MHVYKKYVKAFSAWFALARLYFLLLLVAPPKRPDRQINSFIDCSIILQCRQVYCLVEIYRAAPSAPSWRPPHQRGEFDSFPGRREWPNQCRHKTIVSGLQVFKGHTQAELSPTSTLCQQQPQPWIQRMNPQSKLRWKQWIESRRIWSFKRKTRYKLLGADIATYQTKPFDTDVSLPRKVFRSNHRRRVALSYPSESLIKPRGQFE